MKVQWHKYLVHCSNRFQTRIFPQLVKECAGTEHRDPLAGLFSEEVTGSSCYDNFSPKIVLQQPFKVYNRARNSVSRTSFTDPWQSKAFLASSASNFSGLHVESQKTPMRPALIFESVTRF